MSRPDGVSEEEMNIAAREGRRVISHALRTGIVSGSLRYLPTNADGSMTQEGYLAQHLIRETLDLDLTSRERHILHLGIVAQAKLQAEYTESMTPIVTK